MADDEIYPTHFLDNSRGHKNLILAWTLRFNDVLDGKKLNGALCRLFEIGDWRKLGGRLRIDKRGKLEVHVPKIFTEDRPAVAYTEEKFNVHIDEHPLAKHIPAPTKDASTQRPASDFRSLSVHPDRPSTIQELTSQDIPQMSLHVVTFTDATLVTITWPHTIMDGMSLQGLLRSWSLVLAGKEDEVPALLGAKDDILHEIGSPDVSPEEAWVLQGKLLAGFSFFLFVVRFVWGLLTERTIEPRTIFFPKAAMAKLHREASDDISARHPGKEKTLWVSEGDVIMAWGAKMIAQAQPSPRSINGLCALNIRSRLPEIATAKGLYIQNVTLAAMTLLSKDEAREPLGLIALKCRDALTKQATAPQVRNFLREVRKAWDAGGDPTLLFGQWHGELFALTNWTKGDFVHLPDFSAAVVTIGQPHGMRNNPPGSMVYHQSFLMKQDATVRNVIGVVGKDRSGNYWMMGYFPRRTWAIIDKEIQRMSGV